jgi:spore coat protein A
MPNEGDTEVWEIINMTMDAHPIHTHLAQFQLLNRQKFDGDATEPPPYVPGNGYFGAYIAAFKGNGDINPETGLAFVDGVFKPAFGPPLAYTPSKASVGKLGGNPDITPFLVGPIMPPLPNEAGWKDTVRVMPGQVTRFVVRWAPTDSAVQPNGNSSQRYAFLPNGQIPGKPGAKFDYVWHCHIVDHEDNEMMRPDQVVSKVPEAARKYQMGRDY